MKYRLQFHPKLRKEFESDQIMYNLPIPIGFVSERRSLSPIVTLKRPNFARTIRPIPSAWPRGIEKNRGVKGPLMQSSTGWHIPLLKGGSKLFFKDIKTTVSHKATKKNRSHFNYDWVFVWFFPYEFLLAQSERITQICQNISKIH